MEEKEQLLLSLALFWMDQFKEALTDEDDSAQLNPDDIDMLNELDKSIVLIKSSLPDGPIPESVMWPRIEGMTGERLGGYNGDDGTTIEV